LIHRIVFKHCWFVGLEMVDGMILDMEAGIGDWRKLNITAEEGY
jgi:hypothetical protein